MEVGDCRDGNYNERELTLNWLAFDMKLAESFCFLIYLFTFHSKVNERQCV